jgi:hypothetical protein
MIGLGWIIMYNSIVEKSINNNNQKSEVNKK